MICYYHALPELDAATQREWALLDTHDSLTDWYKHFRTQQQIREALVKLGLVNIECVDRGSNGRGARPPSAVTSGYGRHACRDRLSSRL